MLIVYIQVLCLRIRCPSRKGGTPTYFKGDIFKTTPYVNNGDNNPFGFFYCKITAPENLKHPIIQTHINTKDGIRTVAPLGTWNDLLFSEEMYNAMKFGYKFDVIPSWDGVIHLQKNLFLLILLKKSMN